MTRQKEGDAFALRMVEQLGRTLGMACARIATVVDPEAFVFGGGVSKAGRMLTDVIEKYYDQYAFKTGAKFLLAELGNDAGDLWQRETDSGRPCGRLSLKEDRRGNRTGKKVRIIHDKQRRDSGSHCAGESDPGH